MQKLLVVDDDPGILRAMKWALDGYELLTAEDRRGAVDVARRHGPRVVTLDLGLPPHVDEPSEGLAALEEILGIAPSTKVIVVTGNDDRPVAVQAIAKGAWDFCSKPIDSETLRVIIARAFHVFDLEEENRALRSAGEQPLHGVITTDLGMLRICRTIEKIAPADIIVLLLGESGTGKEVLARALHDLNHHRTGPFVAINCAAIPDNLLESELFGHERGAFTGAVRQVKGKIELANGDTLFLDEIGDMPMALQAKLLRVLQHREIERVGGRTPIPVDVRVVCATNQPLQERVAEGAFREDLYYRISELSIEIPSLRDRGEDTVVLAQHFVERFASEHGSHVPQLRPDAVEAICRHAWRGNVRELQNRVRRAVILAEGQKITAADLDLESVLDRPASLGAGANAVPTLREAREQAERRAISAALAASQGNLTAAARILEVSRPTLYSLLRQHDVRGEPADQQVPPPGSRGGMES
jgi:two-component system NtrC family response regulator